MTLQAPYFDSLYGAEPDPWDFRSRPYEIPKRALTLACLPPKLTIRLPSSQDAPSVF